MRLTTTLALVSTPLLVAAQGWHFDFSNGREQGGGSRSCSRLDFRKGAQWSFKTDHHNKRNLKGAEEQCDWDNNSGRCRDDGGRNIGPDSWPNSQNGNSNGNGGWPNNQNGNQNGNGGWPNSGQNLPPPPSNGWAPVNSGSNQSPPPSSSWGGNNNGGSPESNGWRPVNNPAPQNNGGNQPPPWNNGGNQGVPPKSSGGSSPPSSWGSNSNQKPPPNSPWSSGSQGSSSSSPWNSGSQGPQPNSPWNGGNQGNNGAKPTPRPNPSPQRNVKCCLKLYIDDKCNSEGYETCSDAGGKAGADGKSFKVSCR